MQLLAPNGTMYPLKINEMEIYLMVIPETPDLQFIHYDR